MKPAQRLAAGLGASARADPLPGLILSPSACRTSVSTPSCRSPEAGWCWAWRRAGRLCPQGARGRAGRDAPAPRRSWLFGRAGQLRLPQNSGHGHGFRGQQRPGESRTAGRAAGHRGQRVPRCHSAAGGRGVAKPGGAALSQAGDSLCAAALALGPLKGSPVSVTQGFHFPARGVTPGRWREVWLLAGSAAAVAGAGERGKSPLGFTPSRTGSPEQLPECRLACDPGSSAARPRTFQTV